MTARMTVSERDLRVLAGIVSEDRTDIPARGLAMSLLSDLKDQIHCDVITFDGMDSAREASWAGQAIPECDGIPDQDPIHWRHYWDCQPCSYPDRTGDLRTVIKISDFYSERQWHGSGMYTDLYRPLGFEHELMMSLPAGPGPQVPGVTARLFFFRGPGADFCEADRALLTLLRPHLHRAYLDAESRRRPVPRLTVRQRQLLGLLAAGHTNFQIARRLGLSEGTVRTHLENLYRRLGVSSRAAAVTRGIGLSEAGWPDDGVG